jgi:membrane-associated PAP2 superfamily phosphatase
VNKSFLRCIKKNVCLHIKWHLVKFGALHFYLQELEMKNKSNKSTNCWTVNVAH